MSVEKRRATRATVVDKMYILIIVILLLRVFCLEEKFGGKKNQRPCTILSKEHSQVVKCPTIFDI